MKNFDCACFVKRANQLFGDKSQQEIAKEIGISQTYVSSIKSGKIKSPGADTVFRIAEYYNVSADWLLGLSYFKPIEKNTKGGLNMLRSKHTLERLSRDKTSFLLEVFDEFLTDTTTAEEFFSGDNEIIFEFNFLTPSEKENDLKVLLNAIKHLGGKIITSKGVTPVQAVF